MSIIGSNSPFAIVAAREEFLRLITESTLSTTRRVDGVARILNIFPSLCQERNESDRLPLHEAVCQNAPLELLELLLKRTSDFTGTDVRMDVDMFGFTPLNCACRWSHHNFQIGVYHLLMSPEAIRRPDNQRNLPLHNFCCAGGQWDMQVLRLLVESYPDSVKIPNDNGETPLHLTVSGANENAIPAIRYLVDQYPQAMNLNDLPGFSPLHRACIRAVVQNVPVVRFLLQEYPETAQALDAGGSTPLHVLVKYARQENPADILAVAKVLVEHNPESVCMLNRNGRTPLHLACAEDYGNDLSVIKFLVEKNRDALRVRDGSKETPLHVASRERRTAVIRYLVDECPAVLEEQVVLSWSTPLHALCSTRYSEPSMLLETMELLAISRATVMVRDERGWTPAQCLAYAGNVTPESWHLLVTKYSALPDVAESEHPLHLAVRGSKNTRAERDKYIASIQFLLQQHPDSTQATNSDGVTPLVLACDLIADLSIIYELVRFNPAESVQLLGAAGRPEGTISSSLEENVARLALLPMSAAEEPVQHVPQGATTQKRASDAADSPRAKRPNTMCGTKPVPASMVLDSDDSKGSGDAVVTVEQRHALLGLINTSADTGVDANVRADQVEQLLHEFPQLCKIRDECGYLPLHIATFKEAPLEVLRMLVTCFPQAVAVKGGSGQKTPLHYVCCIPRFSTEACLLLTSKDSARSVDANGRLPLHYYFTRRVDDQDLEAVRCLVEAFPESCKKLDDKGRTPLHVPFLYNGIRSPMQIIRYMVNQCPEALNVVDSNGFTPLHHACSDCFPYDLPVVRFLIEQCPGSTQIRNACGNTPLHEFVEYTREPDPEEILPVVTLLVERFPESVRMTNHLGRLPLHLACADASDYDLPIVKFLVEMYPDALRIRDKERDETPLHIACRAGAEENAEIIEYLVRECPAVLEEQNGNGLRTPLHELCRTSYCSADVFLETMELLAISPAAVTVTDEHGWNAAQCLAYAGNVTLEAWDLLFEKCPDLHTMTDSHGRSALHLAVQGLAAASPLTKLLQYIDTVRVLLSLTPESIQARDNDGATPLMLACAQDVDLNIIYELMRFNPVQTFELLRTGRQELPDESSVASVEETVDAVATELIH